jgi:hypothetical protein
MKGLAMTKRILVSLGLVLVMVACAVAADDPFNGTWQTKYDSFPQLRQLIIAPVDGGVSIQQGEGKPEIILYGKDTLRADGNTINATRIDGHTIKTTTSRDGKVLQSTTGTVSADGMQFTPIIESDGGRMTPRAYDRIGPVPSGDAFFGTWKQNVVPTIYVLKVDSETFDWTLNGKPRLTAKFDGTEYKNSLGAMTTLKRIDPYTIEMISKLPAPKASNDLASKLPPEMKMVWKVKNNTLTLTQGRNDVTAGTTMEFERVK